MDDWAEFGIGEDGTKGAVQDLAAGIGETEACRNIVPFFQIKALKFISARLIVWCRNVFKGG